MWLFTIHGFYSISVLNGSTHIRARDRQHLIALLKRFPHLEQAIVFMPECDYHFRITMLQDVWVTIAAELASEQNWTNFKNEVDRVGSDQDYVHALHEIWGVMHRLQSKRARSNVDKTIYRRS